MNGIDHNNPPPMNPNYRQPSARPENNTSPARQNCFAPSKGVNPYAATIPIAAAVPIPPPSEGSNRVSLTQQPSYTLRNEDIQRLMKKGFPSGLANSLTKTNEAYPLRLWIVDNSGSMNINDGNKIIQPSRATETPKFVQCSRWEEIKQTIRAQSDLVSITKSPTEFRLLNDPGRQNGPQQFSIARGDHTRTDQEARNAIDVMQKTYPQGSTPLSTHIEAIINDVKSMESDLKKDGTKIVVVIATDGLPNDQIRFLSALTELQKLPVWTVVKLCTDDKNVVNFYNELDASLEKPLEVLDDFKGEAKEIYEHNPWLNYAQPLHDCRTMGYHHPIFDRLDESTLTVDEFDQFVRLLFGDGTLDAFPHPAVDWPKYRKQLKTLVDTQEKQWNPRTEKMEPWIDLTRLKKKKYGIKKPGLFGF